MRSFDGECGLHSPDLMICGVNVEPRSPSVFTARILWALKLSPAGDDSWKLKQVRRNAFGPDLP